MTKPGKTPKKKTKEKSPQRTEESEYPAMDEETYNRRRLLRNAIEHSKAELEAKLQQQHKEQLKEVEERLTKKFDDEVRELSRAFDESRYTSSVQSLRCRPRAKPLATNRDRDVPGAKLKVSPIRQYFPDSARFTKIYPHHKIIL